MSVATEALVRAFLTALAQPLQSQFATKSNLGQQLRQLYDSATQTWPGIDLDARVFMTHLAERCPVGDSAEATLSGMRAVDLYIACACAHGVKGAADRCIRAYNSEFGAVFARMNTPRDIGEDIRQMVLDRLFVARPTQPGKITTYSGRGDLRSWIRAAIVRAVISHHRTAQRETPTDDQLLRAFPATTCNQESQLLKATYREPLRRAVQDALGDLPARDRLLLRYKFVDSLTLDDIAHIEGVHRATIARRFVRTRDALWENTRKRFVATLAIEPALWSSILRLLESELDASITTELRRAEY